MSRRHPRIRANLAVTLTIARTGEVLVCRTRDVSHRGCFLDTAQLLERGAVVEIALIDENRGVAIELHGQVTRCPPPRADGQGRGVGIRFDDPPQDWRALVDLCQRNANRPETRAVRLRVLVMGDERRQRGAMALYVTSGWDIRFVPDLESANQVLHGVKLDAVIAESDLNERLWIPLFEAAQRLQPGARRIVRSSGEGDGEPDAVSTRALIDRIVDRDAGLDALLDALTADFGDRPGRSADPAPRRDVSGSNRGDGSDDDRGPADPITGARPLPVARAGALLREVIERARTSAPRGLVVFDLDSTLLDNRPRQARIMREYGAEHGVDVLTRATAEVWQGWDAAIALRNAGLDEDGVRAHFDPFRDYWRERFFTSAYCRDDWPIAGAPAYVRAVLATGARVIYVTGRHEPMREGTELSFRAPGFPFPDRERVHLLMKPTIDEPDDDYKARTYEALRGLGEVVAAFDNEPAHINGYHEGFPAAICVHLATDHSLRKIRVHEALRSIRDFSPFATPDGGREGNDGDDGGGEGRAP